MRTPILRFAVLFSLTSFCLAQAPAPSSPALEQKVNDIVAKMSLEQKIDMLGGINGFDVRAYPEFHLPLLRMADGPLGVRNDGPATAMAGGISLASSWDPALAQRVGEQIGRDARAKGENFMLGPGVNIYRSPLNGRNFEYFGEDPFLGSKIAVGYIAGMQSQGVSATIKHYLGNNSEFDRHNVDSIIDDRTMHEIYTPVFEAAVKDAHVGAVMDSYNLTNGEHMTQNGSLNIGLLKQQYGFQGILMSDWDATYDAVGAANGGLDLEMPSGKFFNREKLLPAVKSGQVSQATIDDKVRRIVRTELEFGWPDREQREIDLPRYNQQGREVALQASLEGMVLLKNEGGVLPLDKNKIRTIAIIGPDAYPAVPVGGGSAQVQPFHAISFLEGLSNYFGDRTKVDWATGIKTTGAEAIATEFQMQPSGGRPGLKLEKFENENLSGAPASTGSSMHVSEGLPFDLSSINFDEIDFSSLMTYRGTSERWTGYYVPKASGEFDVFVQQGGFSPSGVRLYFDDQLILDNWDNEKFIIAQKQLTLDAKPHKIVFEHHTGAGFGPPFVRLGIVPEGSWVDPAAEQMAANADAVVLTVGFTPQSETEGWDRTFELPPGQNELIQKIAAKNKNTIVVITSGGGVDMTPWIDKVAGVIEAWYPGQEGGRALPKILFGDVNPSGHLPATFERQWQDNPTYNNYYPEKGTNRVVYREGVFVGYRGYEHNGTKPLFPFGYGLSYTTFKFSNLKANANQVSFDVTNTGSREGDAVAQVYIAPPHEAMPRPPKELKGFSRVSLQPGETKPVTIPLDTRSFAYYDVNGKDWRAEKGTYEVLVGGSSEDIELRGNVTLGQEMTAK